MCDTSGGLDSKCAALRADVVLLDGTWLATLAFSATERAALRADGCVMHSASQRESDRQGLDTVSGGDLILEPFYIILYCS